MKFTCSVDVNLPVHKVVELFNNTGNLKEWQDGFVSFEQISGIHGEVGAKSKIIYQNRKNIIELIETIIVTNLPHEISGKYEHKHIVNTMNNRFVPLEGNKTKYIAEIEVIKLNGLAIKIMDFLMPGAIKKQTQKWLDQFKVFAERHH